MKNKILLGLAGIVLAFAGWLVSFAPHPVGSISGTQAYVATTTSSLGASATYSPAVCLGSGTFGSIVVVQPATAGYVAVYDATSTATSTYATDSLTSTNTYGKLIAKVLSASDVVGTLTFDTVFYKGVVVETASGFDGQYLVNCKK